jgi:hypothetical protein
MSPAYGGSEAAMGLVRFGASDQPTSESLEGRTFVQISSRSRPQAFARHGRRPLVRAPPREDIRPPGFPRPERALAPPAGLGAYARGGSAQGAEAATPGILRRTTAARHHNSATSTNGNA